MASLFTIAVYVAVACTVASCNDVTGKGTAKGKFDYNGVQCKWHEKRETRSMRSLNIQCGGKSPFSTAYEGDPHKCQWYLDGNQVKYYECLVSALKKAKFCKNSPSQVACDKKNCGDVVFKKTGSTSRLHRVILMKAAELKEEIVEAEEQDWNQFDNLAGFN